MKDKTIFNKLMKTGYIGGKCILLHTKELPINFNGNFDYVKKNAQSFKDLNSMRNVINRLGLTLLEYYYEDITPKRGNGCIEDALKIIFKNNMIPCVNTQSGVPTAVACIGFRGLKGKPNLYLYGDDPFIQLADGYRLGRYLVKYDKNTDNFIKIC